MSGQGRGFLKISGHNFFTYIAATFAFFFSLKPRVSRFLLLEHKYCLKVPIFWNC